MQRQPGGRRPGRLAAPSENPDPALGARAAFRSYISLKLRTPSSPRLGRRALDFALSAKQAASDATAARGYLSHATRSARARAAQPSIRCSAPGLGKPGAEAPFAVFPPFFRFPMRASLIANANRLA